MFVSLGHFPPADRDVKLTAIIEPKRLVGLREQGPSKVAEWADLRTRAFTFLVNNYDQVRRAVTFLRWDQGDADEIAPSLYAGRAPRKTDKSAAQAPAAQTTQATQSVAQASQAGVHAPVVIGPNGPFVAPTDSTAGSTVAQAKTAKQNFPGDNPFMQ